MIAEGKIIEKYDTQNITDTFKIREFVIEFAENPAYPEFVKFQFAQNNCDLLDNFNVGDNVTVNFNLKGRKWTDPEGKVKYFNSLQAWKMENKSGQGNSTAPQTNDMPPANDVPPTNDVSPANDMQENDDLPF